MRAKLQKFTADGVSSLCLLSDFDQTLSKYVVEGRNGHCTFDIVPESGVFPNSLKQEVGRLYRIYGAVERDSRLSAEEKIAKIETWRQLTYAEYLKVGLRESVLPELIQRSNVQLRHGIAEMLRLCRELQVPITVISAGLGNFIKELLTQSVGFDGMQVKSNFMLFGADGELSGFSSPMVYTINKATVLQGEHLPPNVVLLGDMPKDTEVLDYTHHQEALRIAFVNNTAVVPIEEYTANYDILILDDGALDIVVDILQVISGRKPFDEVWQRLTA